MAKTGKGKATVSAREAKELKAKMEEQQKEREVSLKVQQILEEAGYGLQLYLEYSAYGIVPRVRLARNTPPNVKETGNTEYTKETADSNGAASPEQS